ncbi:hypothetical protein ACIRP0_13735 [Streptomyces sp. NPDC101733]|uniref:hypothetical protein n=1 Tax=unclassified Streptomyces TaxID=2593676 RepID=UPI00382BE780
MTLMPYRCGALLLALSAALSGALCPLPASAASAASAVPAVPAVSAAVSGGDPAPRHRHRYRHLHTAEEITRFLRSFYGNGGPTAEDRGHRVSQQLREKQDRTPETDVLLCTHEVPRSIAVGPSTVAQAAGVGWATVTTSWDGGITDTFTAYVRLDSLPIQLDDVICAG